MKNLILFVTAVIVSGGAWAVPREGQAAISEEARQASEKALRHFLRYQHTDENLVRSHAIAYKALQFPVIVDPLIAQVSNIRTAAMNVIWIGNVHQARFAAHYWSTRNYYDLYRSEYPSLTKISSEEQADCMMNLLNHLREIHDTRDGIAKAFKLLGSYCVREE